MKRTVLIAAVVCLCISSAFAKPIDKDNALKAAKSFLVVRFPASDQDYIATATPKGRSALKPDQAVPVIVSGKVVGYVVDLQPKGFILFAADDQAPPVKIYSTDGSFENLPDGLKQVVKLELLEDSFAITSKARPNSSLVKSKRFAQHWDYLTSDQDQTEPFQTANPGVAILTTSWNQGDPYNYYAPAAPSGPAGKAYAGCVPAALAQILRHHRFPAAVKSNHSYIDSAGACIGTHSMNDAGLVPYAWANMPASISSSSSLAQKQAVGQLIYHCGVAVEANFEAGGTGATSSSIPGALVNYFSYTSAGYQMREGYTNTQWYNKIKSDIDNDQPVYYAMSDADSSVGHAVVCDGYRNGNEMHLNLGWSGYGNNWYNLDSVVAGGYTWTNHRAVFDIKPNVLNINLSASPSAGGTVSGAGMFTPGTSCTVTASPNIGYNFVNWTENGSQVSFSNTYTFTLIANRNLVANFTSGPVNYTLNVNSSGAQNVNISSTTAHDGTTNYSKTISSDTSVSLTAPLLVGNKIFTGWTGDIVSSDQTISFSMNSSKTLTANYAVQNFTLKVNSSGILGVNITSPTGHNGSTNYQKTVPMETIVTLTAPSTSGGLSFVGWTGDLNNTDRTISFPMNSDTTLIASYQPSHDSADLNADGMVDNKDLTIFSDQWLQLPAVPSADLLMDNWIDSRDFVIFAKYWLDIDPQKIVWVNIDDPGLSGHENFQGFIAKYETTNAQYCNFLNVALGSGDITVTNGTVFGAKGSNNAADFVGMKYFYTYPGNPQSQIEYSNNSFSVRMRDDYSMDSHPVVHDNMVWSHSFCQLLRLLFAYRMAMAGSS